MNTSAPTESRLPTIRDVASLAGVSVSTVSRVINGAHKVSADTRLKVEDAVAQLDFVTSPAARALRPRTRSRTWGLLVDDVTSFFFGQLVEELDQAGQEQGCSLLVSTTHKLLDRERQLAREMASRRVDGLFIVPASGDRQTLRAREHSVPTVYLDRIPYGTVADVVTYDYYAAVVTQVRELCSRGHRRIGFIGGEVHEDPGVRRFAAYRDTLSLCAVPMDADLISTGHIDRHTAYEAARCQLRLADPPTAIVATTSGITLDVLQAVSERSLNLEIAGSEQFDSAFLSPVPLTLVAVDVAEMARIAGELLTARIEGVLPPSPTIRTLPTTVARFPRPALDGGS